MPLFDDEAVRQLSTDAQLGDEAVHDYTRALQSLVARGGASPGSVAVCTSYLLSVHGLRRDRAWTVRPTPELVQALLGEAARQGGGREPTRLWLIPANVPGHWVLFVVRPDLGVVECLDSMPAYRAREVTATGKALAAAFALIYGGVWSYCAARAPAQRDATSCGVFMLWFARALVDAAADPVTGEALLLGRRRVAEVVSPMPADVCAVRSSLLRHLRTFYAERAGKRRRLDSLAPRIG